MTPHRLPGETRLAGTSSGRRGRTFVAWFRARKPTTSRSPIMFQERLVGVEPTSPAWKAGTSAARPKAHKAEGEGVEPPRLIARPLSRRLPSPTWLDLPYQSCGGRNRTCVRAVNSRLPVPARVPPQWEVRMAGFEPAVSCARSTRNTRLSYILPASPRRTVPLTNVA